MRDNYRQSEVMVRQVKKVIVAGNRDKMNRVPAPKSHLPVIPEKFGLQCTIK